MPNSKYCITFAGPVGSSKTPIAYYLSQKFNLPIFNNDAIRTEVIEDFGSLNQQEYEQLRNERAESFIKTGMPFILDASVDRGWLELKSSLEKNEYQWFIISLDLSKEFLLKLYQAKGYTEAIDQLDQLLLDHDNFLKNYSPETNVRINDQTFPQRLDLVTTKLSEWISK